MNALTFIIPFVCSVSLNSALSLRGATFDAREGRPYLEARKLEQATEWKEALEMFEQLVSSRSEFTDYALLGIGRCYRQLEKPERARDVLEKLLSDLPQSPVVPYARVELGAALADLDLLGESVVQLEQALGIEPSSINKPEVLHLLASTYLKMGRQDNALRTFKRICKMAPRSDQALLSAEHLAETGGVPEKLEATRVYVAQKQWEMAIDVCQQILGDGGADSGQQARVLLELARAYAGADRSSEALETYAAVAERFASSSFGAQALLESATLNARQRHREDAVWIWQRLRNEYPRMPQAVQAQWELARAYDRSGISKEAIAQYAKFAHEHPTSFLADDALFRAGLQSYLSGDYVRAAELLVEATNAASDRLTDDAPYWAGKAYLASGKTHIAAHYFSRSAQVRPAGFYSYRAWAALRELSMIGFTRANRVPLGDRWLMILPSKLSTPTARRKAVIAASPPARLSEPAAKLARRATFLIRHQLPEADWELDKLRLMNVSSNPLQLAQLFLYVEAFHKCVSTAEGLSADAIGQSRVTSLLPYLYPLAYAQQVDKLALTAGLDPLLVHAVMREESRFSGTLVSSAGAIGLMQVIPTTGRWVASQLALDDYDEHSLFDRDVSLTLGTWYLGYLWKEFDGNLIHVLAAYNAGPGNVRRWLNADNVPEDVDGFIETIPLDETRNYIKKVLGTYGNYLQLYR